MHNSRNSNKGFTLIEIIVGIMLLSVLTTFAGMGFFQIANGYVMASRNAVLAQKVQIAILRIQKELLRSSVSSGSSTSISYTSYTAANSGNHTLSWDGNGSSALLLDGKSLLGGYNNEIISFQLAYYDSYSSAASASWIASTTKIIEVTIGYMGTDNALHSFSNRIRLRNS